MQKTKAGFLTIPKLTLTLSLGVIVALASQARADVFTDPVGFITVSALGTNNSPSANPYVNLVGLGMTQLPVSRGNATAPAANTVGVNSALTPGQFNKTPDNNFAYFIELTTGTCVGYQTDIISNDAANVYTVVDLSSCITGTNNYKIYPHWTIGKLFGPNNEAGLNGGTSATADSIQTWSVGSQSYGSVYYFKTSGLGGTGWRALGNTSVNVSNAVVYIDTGLALARKIGTNVAIKVVGGVKLTNTISTVFTNGTTIIGNVYPAGQALGTSGLYTGSPTNGLLGGTSATADSVQLWAPGSQAYGTVYYFKTSGLGGTGWRALGNTSTDVATNQIPLGASIAVVRKPGNPTFNWSAPQPFTQ